MRPSSRPEGLFTYQPRCNDECQGPSVMMTAVFSEGKSQHCRVSDCGFALRVAPCCGRRARSNV